MCSKGSQGTPRLSSPKDSVSRYRPKGRETNVFRLTTCGFNCAGGSIAKFGREECSDGEPHIQEGAAKTAESEVANDELSRDRVFHVVVSHQLLPITDLYGDEFLHAWWDAVECHLVLWENSVCHRDASPPNLTYYEENGNVRVVLKDFDLAFVGADGPPGTKRAGTVPFMALKLLTHEGLRGEIPHLYEHDAESFIWTLTWISMRYSGGKYLENETLDEWLRVDAVRCSEKKAHFLLGSSSLLDKFPAGEGHGTHLEIAQKYLGALFLYYLNADENLREPGAAFKVLLLDPIQRYYKQDGKYAYCPTWLQVEKPGSRMEKLSERFSTLRVK